jgi:hypothetical protein
VSKIATILLVTERPGSAELPAIGPPFSSSGTEIADRHVFRKGTPQHGFGMSGGMRYLIIRAPGSTQRLAQTKPRCAEGEVTSCAT